jgi:L-rhamnonate dehydratase
MTTPKIVKVEWARLEGQRPRAAGCNARLGVHGLATRTPMVRITTDDGITGFGACFADPVNLSHLLDVNTATLFSPSRGVSDEWLAFEYPIWDLIGKLQNLPVYALAAQVMGQPPPTRLRTSCYDTSLYIDDLHLSTDEAAAQFMVEEARAGMSRGHTAFKLKVGRGARHMPLEAGTRRDIQIILAVREAIGSQATLMLDANNGYNLNLAKRVLEETALCKIHWLEEAFHEDQVLYEDLANWLRAHDLHTLIADGEGEASTHLLDWAAQGLINVVQYDIFGHGFTRWLHTGKYLDSIGAQSAPHHYGWHYGNYVACHLAAAIQHFASVEWDESHTPGIDGSMYSIQSGQVNVPDLPGFGVLLVEDEFQRMVALNGGEIHK